MTKRTLWTMVAATLETLDEGKDGWSPETFLYLPFTQALGIHLDDWKFVLGIMLEQGWVTHGSDVVTITTKGREMAKKTTAARAAAKEKTT